MSCHITREIRIIGENIFGMLPLSAVAVAASAVCAVLKENVDLLDLGFIYTTLGESLE